jgi:hypothetical protein
VGGNHDQAAHCGFGLADDEEGFGIEIARQRGELSAGDKANGFHQRDDDHHERFAVSGDGELPVHEMPFRFRTGGIVGWPGSVWTDLYVIRQGSSFWGREAEPGIQSGEGGFLRSDNGLGRVSPTIALD